MKKEFITPIIETEMLTPRETVMVRVLKASDESVKTIITDTRPEENDHWYGSNR